MGCLQRNGGGPDERKRSDIKNGDGKPGRRMHRDKHVDGRCSEVHGPQGYKVIAISSPSSMPHETLEYCMERVSREWAWFIIGRID